ncbi:disease resistance-like protein DSC1 [Morus notabilis]|uniref:disease resistance-like protein DSC1 n=1 Tax=Morus notabilis TaxID=981085 RepID=UPI000CED1818|nr:disease resistance-like protein DSC1 [Morus notabilis]
MNWHGQYTCLPKSTRTHKEVSSKFTLRSATSSQALVLLLSNFPSQRRQVAKRAFILFVDMDGFGVSPPCRSSICEKYDVFLSFRGEDTRDNFTSHLYAALKRKQIKTYIDEEILQKGDDINLALPEAIQKSNIAIIIFSEDYASSTWPDTKLIEEVVEDVLKKLQSTVLSSADALKGMIGMEERCEQLESLLSIGSANTRIISLFGMGGIGKTTLANAVYGRIFSHFESCCFLKNVREESERVYDGLEELRKKLFAKLLGEKTVDLETPSSLEIIKMRLRKIRVLIVLDDVSKSKQLEHLVGDGDCFASGSRILLTTREQKVLRTIRRNNGVETHEDEVKQLSDSEALDLFNFTAFDERKPPSEYVELSKEAVRYAGCIPLAIKVVGSELRSLREPNEKKWEKALKIFKMSPPTDISEG